MRRAQVPLGDQDLGGSVAALSVSGDVVHVRTGRVQLLVSFRPVSLSGFPAPPGQALTEQPAQTITQRDPLARTPVRRRPPHRGSPKAGRPPRPGPSATGGRRRGHPGGLWLLLPAPTVGDGMCDVIPWLPGFLLFPWADNSRQDRPAAGHDPRPGSATVAGHPGSAQLYRFYPERDPPCSGSARFEGQRRAQTPEKQSQTAPAPRTQTPTARRAGDTRTCPAAGSRRPATKQHRKRQPPAQPTKAAVPDPGFSEANRAEHRRPHHASHETQDHRAACVERSRCPGADRGSPRRRRLVGAGPLPRGPRWPRTDAGGRGPGCHGPGRGAIRSRPCVCASPARGS